MSRPRTPFELRKWYFDCVSGEGHAFVGYLGSLHWKSLTVHYQSALLQLVGEKAQNRFSLRRCAPPSIRGGTLEWKSAALQIEATWDALDRPIGATILDTDAGTVEWNCVQPRAAARVRFEKTRRIEGLGYAESLRLTIPPWGLPLKELHWGRFLSETASIIWIDWRGPYAKRIVFHNGLEAEAESITDKEVVLRGRAAVLKFEERQVLREGTLADTALSGLSGLGKLLPGGALRITERKWKSRAVLQGSGGAEVRGWAIHEVVLWP